VVAAIKKAVRNEFECLKKGKVIRSKLFDEKLPRINWNWTIKRVLKAIPLMGHDKRGRVFGVRGFGEWSSIGEKNIFEASEYYRERILKTE
tara:strand:- start:503 stop:775 length:273 start_codon:yes stop_codon:yes gene_type:complete